MQTTNLTFITSDNETSPEMVGQLVGEVFGGIAAAVAQGSCQAAIDTAVMSTIQIATTSLPPGVSYCQWLGVICCITGEFLLADLQTFKMPYVLNPWRLSHAP